VDRGERNSAQMLRTDESGMSGELSSTIRFAANEVSAQSILQIGWNVAPDREPEVPGTTSDGWIYLETGTEFRPYQAAKGT
jgi:hypothetical protein